MADSGKREEAMAPLFSVVVPTYNRRDNLARFLESVSETAFPRCRYEVINPIQTSCRDMEPERLKRESGKDICFWGGGCDTRAVINRGTPAQVKEHVKRRLEIFSPGGGFIFNTIHNILPEVPPQNVVAMFEAIEEFGAK